MGNRKVLFYAGNKLSGHGVSVTTVETLTLQLEGLGFEVISVSDKKNKILRLIHMVWSLIVHRKKVGAVLIDTYSTWSFAYAVALSFASRCLKLPYFPILHGGQLPSRLKRSPKLTRYVFENSVMNLAPSASLKSVFEKHGYKVITIPNNIHINEYVYKPRHTFSYRILWVRSFHHIYNPQLAIRLVRALVEKGMDPQLCMVGPDKDGCLQECRELAINLGVQDRITFTGRVSKAEWRKISEDYDVFINTTFVDNTPISVIEAMALGLPVVSTNVGGIPFLLDDGRDSVLVESDNLEQLTDALIDTVNRPADTQMRVEAARRKAESFDWDRVKVLWLSLLNPYLGQ